MPAKLLQVPDMFEVSDIVATLNRNLGRTFKGPPF